MRWWFMLVCGGVAACAGTARVCPTDTRLASEDRPTGRVEWCARTTGGFAAMPAPGREFSSLLGMAHPTAMSGGLHGPFTHWYPNGGVESHGQYVEEGATSFPDGVWGFWYATGERKAIGRYDRGRPAGCFALWDEHGERVTGVVEGDQLRVTSCAPPADDALVAIEDRSQPESQRKRWGDASMHALAQTGTFGASNPTQREPDPSARATLQAAFRRHLGRVRVGPVLGLRFASDDARAYTAGVAVGVDTPLPIDRLALEAELQLSVQYLELTARRPELAGVGSVSFWSPLGGARLALSFAVTSSVDVVVGGSIDGAPTYEVERAVQYCAPFCTLAVGETWTLGGAAYGVNLGLRLRLR